jgi:hypothetical protein
MELFLGDLEGFDPSLGFAGYCFGSPACSGRFAKEALDRRGFARNWISRRLAGNNCCLVLQAAKQAGDAGRFKCVYFTVPVPREGRILCHSTSSALDALMA